MKRIKVIHLLETFRLGGMENLVCQLCASLDKEKFDVEIWALAEGGVLEARAAGLGVKTRVLGLKTYRNPLNVLALAGELSGAGADILHAHGYFCSVFGRLAGLRARVPSMVTHLHTTFHSLGFRSRLVDRSLNRFTGRVVCVSEAVRESFFRAGYGGREKFLVIYNGVDEAAYSFPPAPKKDPVLFSAGSLYPHKGHKFLLEAFKAAAQSVPGLRLRIAGGGPLLEELTARSRDLGLGGSVEFLGERNDIPALLSAASLFVLPSVREGFSLACVEAMAAGLPVAAFNSGGVGEVVLDGETGLLCPAGDSAALGRAIVRLLKAPAALSAMGARGRIRVEEKFTLKRMAAEVTALYEALVPGHGRENSK
ncbi:MAG: hypothetical protein A2X32_06080 [Elusimicrobia bacterium GWC2_64_44]|nr:MAG: hypothetical protein A2X32_06080 [Elusimicrobia bacterium GWC2_64_44]